MPNYNRRLPWLNSGDRLALAIVFSALIGLLVFHYARRVGLGKASPQLEQSGKIAVHRVDINTAEHWELQALHGIGEKLAQDIIEYRRENGRFETVDELAEVAGIGAKTLNRLRPYLMPVGGKERGEKGQ